MFARVRDAFPKAFRNLMERLDVQIIHEKDDGWCDAKCPLCSDQSGSAGIHSRTGMLKCHQCGTALELFTWVQRKKNLSTPWDACTELASMLQMQMPVARDDKKQPAALTEERVGELEVALWGSKNFYVGELAARGFTPEELSVYRLGRSSNGLIFPQWNSSGLLLPRAHLWRGPKVEPKWMWWPNPGKQSQGTGSPIGIWPLWIPPEGNQDIWLMEGEWDCLIARTKFGLAAYTWTGGAGSPLVKDKLPSWMIARTIHVVYDMDVYCGPESLDEKNKLQQNFFNKVLPPLLQRQNRVIVHWVPLDPVKFPKGDFRDWWGNGGRDLHELKTDTFTEADLRIGGKKRRPENTTVGNIGNMVGKPVRFVASVASVSFDTRIVYDKLTIKCDIDNHRACATCRISRDHQDGEIDLKSNPGLTARLFLEGDIYSSVRQWIHPGHGCPGFEIEEIEEQKPSKSCYVWTAGPPTDSEAAHVEVQVLSPTQPAIAKDHVVEGWVAPELTQARPIVEATEISTAERLPFEMGPWVEQLKEITPWNCERADEILAYLDLRERELADHVTEIYEAPWARAIELVAHSSLFLPRPSGRIERGWLDCCLVGYTRTGKTTTARRLLEMYGLGRYASAQSAVTKAGITVTLEKIGATNTAGWRAKPGLYPRLDGQMLVLDEVHALTDSKNRTNSVMQELQSARDIGTLEIVKAVNIKYQARVRLVTMANPPQKLGFSHYAFPCEVIKDLYCTDEAVARTDFLVVGLGQALQPAPSVKTKPRWNRELANALVRRAWESTAAKIVIPPECERKAEEIVEIWSGVYSQDLPLFTPGEKVRTLMRVAIAVSNLCFSHDGPPDQILVRQAHVEIARAFLEESFSRSGYDSWSANRLRKSLPQPLVVERMLWVCIERPSDVQKFESLGGENGRNQLAEILGLTTDQASIRVETWISRMIGSQGLQISRPGFYVLSDLGRSIAIAMIRYVKEHPEDWRGRIMNVDGWLHHTIPGGSEPKSLVELVSSSV